jgi:ribosome-associated protein
MVAYDESDEEGEGATPEGPSRSQVKREHRALQDLAERLLALPRAELERLRLSEATWVAIDETARIRDPRALRRHYKRIANLLEREDPEPIAALTAAREALARQTSARHHETERWRERLIEEGDAALGELLARYPTSDRQHLRALVRAARRDRDQGRPEGPRRLFRAIRDLVEGAGEG